MKTNIDIKSKASLVGLHISLPGNTKSDPSTTAQVKQEHNLGQNAGEWRRRLFPKEALQDISSLAGATRNWHYSQTLVYPDDGWCILPAKIHLDYMTEIGKRKSDFACLVSRFESHFDEYVEWARIEHNGTFDPSLYDLHKVMAKFNFEVEFRPIPASTQYEADIRHLLGADAQSIDEYVQEAAENAQKELVARIRGVLGEVASLRGRERKPKSDFIKDLFKRLSDLQSLVPKLNLADDIDLNSMATEISNAFARHEPMTVRESDHDREQVADKAKALLAKMDGYNF